MGQPTFASDVPLTPTVRILTADECAENWNALYGCIGMWAEEYWNGSAWVRRFHIFGTGVPSTTYDGFKTIGSIYMDYATGEEYRVKSLNGTLTWCLCADIIRQTEGDAAISNIQNLALGTLVMDTNDNKLWIHITAATDEVIGAQTAPA